MAEQNLNGAGVTAAAQNPIGGIMPQFVRGELVGNLGHFSIPLEHPLHGPDGKPPMPPILKERSGGFGGKAALLVKAQQLEYGLLCGRVNWY